MPPTNSQVPRIELNSSGTISLMIDVYGFDEGTPVEVSGQVTQDNGAVATLYSVQAMPAHDDDESAVVWLREVQAIDPKKSFAAGFPITAVVRVTEAWITVLSPLAEAASPGATPSSQDPQAAGAIQGAWEWDYFGTALAPSPPEGAAPAPAATIRDGR